MDLTTSHREGAGWRKLRGGALTPVGPTRLPLWGAAGNSSTQPPTSLEAESGRPVGVRRHYWQAAASSVDSSITTAAADISAQRVPWLSYKLPGEWDACAAGVHDAWAQDICARLGALPGRVLLTFHHEPEGESSGGQLMREFAEMHSRFAGFAAAYPNIKCGPILAGWHTNNGTNPLFDLDSIWPNGLGNGDFIAHDPYNFYGRWSGMGAYDGITWTPPPGGTQSFVWTDLVASKVPLFADWATDQGIEWAIGEFGMSPEAEVYEETHFGSVTMLHRLWEAATTYDNCLALAYFDSAYNSASDWRLIGGRRTAWVDVAAYGPGWETTWQA